MIDGIKLKNECVQWIRDWFAANGKNCNAVVGISGGKDSTVVAGLLVKHIQGNGNTLFGISVNAPQVLGLVSTLIFVGAFIFAKLVVEKQKIMRQ